MASEMAGVPPERLSEDPGSALDTGKQVWALEASTPLSCLGCSIIIPVAFFQLFLG